MLSAFSSQLSALKIINGGRRAPVLASTKQMKTTRNDKIILGLALVFLMAQAGSVCAQPTKTFTGVVKEIGKATNLNIGQTDTFYIVRLDNYPNAEFRLPPGDAVRYGLIETAGSSGVVTPKQSKGLGWKVKLTCDNKPQGPVKAPIYRVLSLERVNHKD
ncbi:MAG: hypothetical protein Q8M54_03210 [Desulfobaccales bacterium]|nr:hypothetical protein [Desulfobaccales bacterium]